MVRGKLVGARRAGSQPADKSAKYPSRSTCDGDETRAPLQPAAEIKGQHESDGGVGKSASCVSCWTLTLDSAPIANHIHQ